MLSQISISNYTIVSDLEMEFSRGMTVITGETGSLVPPGNATALAAAIDRCLSMPEAERIKLSNRAMTHAEKNFSREKMVNQTFDVYAEILHDLSQKSGA